MAETEPISTQLRALADDDRLLTEVSITDVLQHYPPTGGDVGFAACGEVRMSINAGLRMTLLRLAEALEPQIEEAVTP